MAANINTLPGPVSPSADSASADQFIRKIVVMCDEHAVAWGTPQKLAGFIEALQSNKRMAMDFWSTVARMSDQSSGVGPNRVLEVIVEGVTGRSIAEVMVTGRAERGAVGDLTRLLAGEDVWSPVTEIPVTESPVIENPESSRRFEVSADSEDSPQTKDNAETAPANTAPASTDVQRGEELAGEVASAASSAPRTNRASWTSPPPPPTSKSVPLTPRQQYPVRVRSDDPFVRVPLGEYSETGKNRRAPVIVVLLLLTLGAIAGGTFLMRGNGIEYKQKFETTWQRFETTVRHAWSGDAAKENASSPVDSSGVQNSPVANGNVDEGSQSEAAQVPNKIAAPATPSPATPSPEPRAAAGAGGAARERMNRSATVTAAAEAGRRADLAEVPASAMQARLLSSRVPVYPDAARADHVEGRVVMQAVVTKDGAVGHLHVTSGDPILRAAALEAVSAWRYRPYLVNGEPVDVSTTISVDFLVDK